MSAAGGRAPLPEPGSIRCPRCSSPIGPEQDWCLECGAPARTRLAPTPNWRLPDGGDRRNDRARRRPARVLVRQAHRRRPDAGRSDVARRRRHVIDGRHDDTDTGVDDDGEDRAHGARDGCHEHDACNDAVAHEEAGDADDAIKLDGDRAADDVDSGHLIAREVQAGDAHEGDDDGSNDAGRHSGEGADAAVGGDGHPPPAASRSCAAKLNGCTAIDGRRRRRCGAQHLERRDDRSRQRVEVVAALEHEPERYAELVRRRPQRRRHRAIAVVGHRAARQRVVGVRVEARREQQQIGLVAARERAPRRASTSEHEDVVARARRAPAG